MDGGERRRNVAVVSRPSIPPHYLDPKRSRRVSKHVAGKLLAPVMWSTEARGRLSITDDNYTEARPR